MTAISKKKIIYKVKKPLRNYLRKYEREIRLPVSYDELKNYDSTIPLFDRKGKDTLWEIVFYQQGFLDTIHLGLRHIYSILKTGGDDSFVEHLHIERIDYCTFGNSNPFRIKIVNNYNDNYDYFYIKQADASRIYGLELEDILSPERINYFVDEHTLVEEHIAGIPGDQFIKNNLDANQFNLVRIAKEFVKFNERCFVRLLGDMRSYNFVFDLTPDFEEVQFRIRAIDFDQQCYEGKRTIYMPQFFKENNAFVELVTKYINAEVIRQYQHEEHVLVARRIKSSRYRLKDLLDVMISDEISVEEKINQLRNEMAVYYHDPVFTQCKTMGEILKRCLKILLVKAFHKDHPVKIA